MSNGDLITALSLIFTLGYILGMHTEPKTITPKAKRRLRPRKNQLN